MMLEFPKEAIHAPLEAAVGTIVSPPSSINAPD